MIKKEKGMTNNLNSVIIEGTITKTEKVENAAYFTVCTNRYFKDTYGEIHVESSFFEIEVYGKLAESCKEVIKENVDVRVVGRLKSLRYLQNKVVIVAEHIETKPVTVNKEN